MRSGLAVRANSRRLVCGERRILENERGVLREGGVMYEPCVIGAVLGERLQNLFVHRANTLRWNGAVDGESRQLVTKADPLGLHFEQAASAGLIECTRPRAQNGLDEPCFGSCG